MKYQEALDNLKEYEYYDGEYDIATKPYNEDYSKYSIVNDYKKSVDTLQELIDICDIDYCLWQKDKQELELCKKAFEYSCNVLSTNSMFHIKNNRLENINSNASADWQNYFTNVARKELNNEI